MIVHLVGSLQDPKVDVAYLRQIIEIIHDHGAVLAYDWLEEALNKTHDPDWTPHVDTNLDAIRRADVVIVDVTHYSFLQGFLVAAALRHKKPVLALSRSTTKNHAASHLKSLFFTYSTYSSSADLKPRVESFLIKNTIFTKDLRFNMFLTRQIFKYLEETSRDTGKSRSEIIRALVKRRAEENHG